MANETPEPKQQHTTIILLIAILLAAGAVAAVIYFIPGADNTADPFRQSGGSTNVVGVQGFDTGILQSREYSELDLGLLQRGLLPVQPPAGTGKTNIFR